MPIRAVRVAADVPEAERTPLEVLRTDTPTFAALVEAAAIDATNGSSTGRACRGLQRTVPVRTPPKKLNRAAAGVTRRCRSLAIFCAARANVRACVRVPPAWRSASARAGVVAPAAASLNVRKLSRTASCSFGRQRAELAPSDRGARGAGPAAGRASDRSVLSRPCAGPATSGASARCHAPAPRCRCWRQRVPIVAEALEHTLLFGRKARPLAPAASRSGACCANAGTAAMSSSARHGRAQVDHFISRRSVAAGVLPRPFRYPSASGSRSSPRLIPHRGCRGTPADPHRRLLRGRLRCRRRRRGFAAGSARRFFASRARSARHQADQQPQQADAPAEAQPLAPLSPSSPCAAAHS